MKRKTAKAKRPPAKKRPAKKATAKDKPPAKKARPAPPATVDAIVARWRAGHYTPRPPAPPAVRAAFLAEVRARCGLEPPADYVRFLELCDGGQNDAYWLFGAAEDTRSHYDPTPQFLVGDSGNMDLYVIRPDGRAEIVELTGGTQVYESFPTFTALLDRLIRA